MTSGAPFARAWEGRTTHARSTPFTQRFSYRLAQISLDIDHVAETARALKLLAYNRFNLFSFHDRDHGDRSGAPLRPWAEQTFAAAGIDLGGGRIELMCFPRMLGFVFNPLSVYFGYRPDGRLAGVIYEVNNTFGETHAYVAATDDGVVHNHETQKLFHVSPLFAVEGDYRFRIQTPGEHFRLVVENRLSGARTHLATLVSTGRPLTDGWLARIFLTMPMMTLQVVLGIHWEALKLFLRGARYHRRPPLPAAPVSFARAPQLGTSSMTEPAKTGTAMTDTATAPERATAAAIARLKAPASFKACCMAALNLHGGRLDMTLPDGRKLVFGDAETPVYELQVKDYAFARRVFSGGDIGLAESYMAGEWDTPDLSATLTFLNSNVDRILGVFRGKSMVARAANFMKHFSRENTREGSRRNILEHYDLGNRFYAKWLDRTMTYSAARFDRTQCGDLTNAQLEKYRALARHIDLKPGDHVLEIGCGWGGFAEVAAREYGARVTGLTISDEQHAFATERMKREGLSDRVEIRLQDYRDVKGAFDKVASIEMFEAVGEKYWPAYFSKIAEVLKPGGRAGLQIITIRDDLFERYRSRVDFIQRYVFPGGMLPSLQRLEEETSRVGLKRAAVDAFGVSYADTLAEWGRRFRAAWGDIRPLGFDERFKRLWQFYLSYCEAGFRTGNTDVVQIALAKPR